MKDPKRETEIWNGVRQALRNADAITWDGCHKIYVTLDAEQTEKQRSYGYDPLLKVGELGVAKALRMLKTWYANSCPLRFIQSIRTVSGDPNDGYTDLISLGEGWGEEDEEA